MMTLAQVVADTGGFDHMNGFGWGMMGFAWIMGLLIIGLVVWAVVHSTQQSRSSAVPNVARTAEAILADRFARGEIDDDEYRRRLDTLRS
jgi:putative membrane protein